MPLRADEYEFFFNMKKKVFHLSLIVGRFLILELFLSFKNTRKKQHPRIIQGYNL